MNTRNAWRKHAAECAEFVYTWMLNRDDAYGLYLPLNGAPERPVITSKDGLDPQKLAQHFADTKHVFTVGLHTAARDESRFGVIDVDLHEDDEDTVDPQKNLRAAFAFAQRIRDCGLDAMVEDSNGRGGYHVWVIFCRPVSTGRLYLFLAWVIRDWKVLGLTKAPETFPKQPSVDENAFGNWIRLPGLHHTYDHLSRFHDGERWLEGVDAVYYFKTYTPGDPDLIPEAATIEPEPPPTRTAPSSKPSSKPSSGSRGGGKKGPWKVAPWDAVKDRFTWADIMAEAGGHHPKRNTGGHCEWTRPGKPEGCSGETGWDGHDSFKCFSNNWSPFDKDQVYSRFDAWALAFHGISDFDAACDKAVEEGFGERAGAQEEQNQNGQSDGQDQEKRKPPPKFDLGMVDSASLCGEVAPPRWLIKNVLVADNPAIVGGPMKTLKTSILIDLVVSLGTGCNFLGRFDVPKPIKVGMISGESGRYVIRQNALEIARTRGRDLSDDDNIKWGFTLPDLSDGAHLKVAEKMIQEFGLECLIIDPFYLCLPGEAIDPKNMFSMGPVLDALGKMCLGAGCLPILAHDFVKSRENPYAPPELHELAYGGVSQWMRQWCLVTRRETYDANSGLHKLHWRHGGSFGHSGELSLDIDTGVIDENFNGRKWEVTVHTTSQRIATQEQERQAKVAEREAQKAADKKAKDEQQDREDMAAALKILGKQSDRRLTKTKLREIAGWNSDRAGHVLYLLDEGGYVKTVEYEAAIGKGATRLCQGYELIK